VTGVVYWWMLNMLEPVSEFAVINHPLQPWMLKAHIVTSPLLVFALGLIAVDHVWKQYRLGIRAGRRSGTTAMWVFVPMVVSGYLVQAVTTPIWLTATVWLHLGTSMVFLVGLAAHQVAVPRRRARRGAREVDLTVVRDEGPSGSPIRSPSRKRARVRAERS
jgi:hypothetical protein